MSENFSQHRKDYQKILDAINTGDLEKMTIAFQELTTQGFTLHHMSDPKRDETLEEFLEGTRSFLQKFSSPRVAFEDCFSRGDMLAAHITAEVVSKDTKEKRRWEEFFVDRFEGDKLAEEWVWRVTG